MDNNIIKWTPDDMIEVTIKEDDEVSEQFK